MPDVKSVQTLHDAIVTSIPQLSSALVGGIIGLAVSLAANNSNTKRLRVQFELERLASGAKERRQKGEELFVLLHFWYSNFAGHYLAMSMAMQGKLTFNQVLDSDIVRGREFGSKYEAPRIELYIKAYFPSCSGLHVDVLSNVQKLNAIDSRFKHSYESGDPDGSHFLREHVGEQHRFESSYDALRNELIEELRKI